MTEKQSKLLDLVRACRSEINAYHFGCVAGIVILILFIMKPTNFTITFWIISISWLICLILFTIWRFTGLKKIYDVKLNKNEDSKIKRLIVIEFFTVTGFIGWFLIWFSIPMNLDLIDNILLVAISYLMLTGLMLFMLGLTYLYIKK